MKCIENAKLKVRLYTRLMIAWFMKFLNITRAPERRRVRIAKQTSKLQSLLDEADGIANDKLNLRGDLYNVISDLATVCKHAQGCLLKEENPGTSVADLANERNSVQQVESIEPTVASTTQNKGSSLTSKTYGKSTAVQSTGSNSVKQIRSFDDILLLDLAEIEKLKHVDVDLLDRLKAQAEWEQYTRHELMMERATMIEVQNRREYRYSLVALAVFVLLVAGCLAVAYQLLNRGPNIQCFVFICIIVMLVLAVSIARKRRTGHLNAEDSEEKTRSG